MTIASETRSAVREHPFLYDGLRAGVINYTATARFLDVGDTDAVAAALRRYAEELDTEGASDGRVSVSMRSDVGETADGEHLLSVGTRRFGIESGGYTAIVATGDLGTAALEALLGRLRTAETDVVAAAGVEGSVTVVVERRAAPDALRIVEESV